MSSTTREKIGGKMCKRIKKFCSRRVSEIVAGNVPTPFDMADGPKAILHFLPVSSLHAEMFIDECVIDIDTMEMQEIHDCLPYSHPNLDGVVHYSYETPDDSEKNLTTHYIQVFRNGVVEVVVAPCHAHSTNGNYTLSFVPFSEKLLFSFYAILNFAKRGNLNPPAVVGLTLVETKGCLVAKRDPNPMHPFDRDTLSIPGTLLESYDKPPVDTLFPLLDIMWQAGGQHGLSKGEEQRLIRFCALLPTN